MSAYSELIKNFDKIRNYMRDFYIYGYKTRSDFEYKSLRTYDNEKRRIESWLKNYIDFSSSKKGKQISISCDSGKIYENPLYNAYFSKSFTDNDIELHFFITDVLKNSAPLTVDEITDKIFSQYDVYFEPQTIRIKLKEYASEGIVRIIKNKKAHMFELCTDCPENICDDSEKFFDMIRFFSQSAPFGVIGSYILRQYDKINRTFLIKHNFIVHTLEDNVMLSLINAIDEKKSVEIVHFGKNENKTVINAVPVEFHISLQTGRRYIITYVDKIKRFNSFRLDYIKKVKILDECSDYDMIAEKYAANQKYCWGSSFGSRRISGNTQKLKITLLIDEEKEDFIIKRLVREGRNGTVSRTEKNIYTYETELFDVCEASPWIKTFIGRIISVECSDKSVSEKFYNDIFKMDRMYQKGD